MSGGNAIKGKIKFLNKWRSKRYYPLAISIIHDLYFTNQQEYEYGKDYYEFLLLVRFFTEHIDGELPDTLVRFFYSINVPMGRDLYKDDDYKDYLDWKDKEDPSGDETMKNFGCKVTRSFSRFLRNKYRDDL